MPDVSSLIPMKDDDLQNLAHRLHDLPILFQDLQLNQFTQDEQHKIAQIDACLPQTQCGLCGHADGCLPYATAIVRQEENFNQCVPGGQPVTDTIASILGRQSLPVAASKWQVNPQTQRPIEVKAIIREDDCIGCTKCIPACPVDAIVGTGKQMHTIFAELCTGCELCLPPCPVDCIELVAVQREVTEAQRQTEQQHLRQRYHHHLNRVAEQLTDKANSKPVVSMVQAKLNNVTNASISVDEQQAKNTIELAKLRTKIKKLEKQLHARYDDAKQQALIELKQQLSLLES